MVDAAWPRAVNRETELSERRMNWLYAMTAGMATASPIPVATSASEISDITVPAPPLRFPLKVSKALMMPITVPRRPMNGAFEPRVPRKEVNRSRISRYSDPRLSMRPWGALPRRSITEISRPRRRHSAELSLQRASRQARSSPVSTRERTRSSNSRSLFRRFRKWMARSTISATDTTERTISRYRTHSAPSRATFESCSVSIGSPVDKKNRQMENRLLNGTLSRDSYASALGSVTIGLGVSEAK